MNNCKYWSESYQYCGLAKNVYPENEHGHKEQEPLRVIETAELIAELERRRPCLECARNSNSIGCDGCAYNWPPIQSNFKPRPTTEQLPDQTKGEGL